MRPPIKQRQTTLPWKQVHIEDMTDDGIAMCVDQFGHHINIPVSVRRSKGVLPAVGETWIVDQAIGHRWSFAAVVNAQPPTVSGSRQANPALASLLAALDGGGIVRDGTTLGSAPGEGDEGVTDHGALTGLGDDDHPQYLRQAEADILYDVDGAASDAVIDHEGDPDPHPQYAQLSLLGTAATADIGDFATPAQGALADGAVPKGTGTTKGDLVVWTAASTPARLGVGANGTTPFADSSATPGILWARAARTHLFEAGSYTPAGPHAAAGSHTASRLYYLPVFIPERRTFTALAINHTATVSTTGGYRLGLYETAAGGGGPGARLIDAGVADTSTAAGGKEAPAAITVDPGLYWVAAVQQITGASIPQVTTAGASPIQIPTLAVATSTGLWRYENGVAGALPATAAPTTQGTQAPMVWMKAA